MTPIISPWVFYLMSVVGNIRTIAITMILLATASLAIGTPIIFTESNVGNELRNILNFIKKIVPVLLLSGIVVIFVPSETTITKMIVAQNVTYERVDTVTDTVETVYNDIMNLFEKSSDADG